jgi:capsular exopolysaccharide synthesis family protein
MDQRVKSVSDLAVLPGANVLGGIPDLADDPTKTTAAELVVRKHPTSVLAESYRQITTSLLPMMDRNGHQTLLMVGVMPGAGTTTVISNIAATAASSGRSVLVVDANFRRPRLAQAMGLSNDAVGLADLLSGAATLDQAIVDAGDGISVISAGTPANRVFDRVSNGTFESLVAEWRGQFDLIIFDAPPVIVAGDAMVLANKVDAAVLVVRAHQEHRGLVARMMHRLADARCEMLGVLLNRPRGITGGYFKKNYATMAQYTAGSS